MSNREPDGIIDFGATPSKSFSSGTGDRNIDGLLSGNRWIDFLLAYSFPDSVADFGAGYPDSDADTPNILATFTVFSTKQEDAADYWLDQYANVSGLTFRELDGANGALDEDQEATLRFANSQDPRTAYARHPSQTEVAGDMWFNGSGDDPDLGDYDWVTIGHELGHALGLKHPHEVEGTFGTMEAYRDSMEFSVMSYRSYVGASTGAYTNAQFSYAQSLMMYDIAAIQYMYGANFAFNSASTTYKFSPTTGEMFINGVGQGTPGDNIIFRTIWDGGGRFDTYDFSNFSTNLDIDLRPGQWTDLDVGGNNQRALLSTGDDFYSRGHVFNALQYGDDVRSLIEDAYGGSGNDTITGNQANNSLWGNGGNDYLVGNEGLDSLYGGAGDDYLWGDGFFGAVSGDGDYLGGGDGNDTLIGDAGADILDGGAGIDTVDYSFSSPDGVVVRLADGAPDARHYVTELGETVTIIPGATGFRGAAEGDIYFNIENVTGTRFADGLVGSDGPNVLKGLDGDDYLGGFGGDDTLIGGLGKDYLDGGDGIDTVSYQYASSGINVDLLIDAYNNRGEAYGDMLVDIENARGSNHNDNIHGNSGDNTFWTLRGDDYVDGRGGIDTVVFSGLRKDYVVGMRGGDITVTDQRLGSSNQGADSLRNVEFLRFADGTFAIADAMNDAPRLVAVSGVNVAENSVAVMTVAASDPDGDTLVYSIVGGADSAKFRIDGSTGALRFVAPQDYERPADIGRDNVYEVTVRASDGILLDERTISVTVTDVRPAIAGGTAGNDGLVGSSFEDMLIGSPGDDILDGGDDIDTVAYDWTNQGVIVNLAGFQASGAEIGTDQIVNIENVIGGSGDDTITGNQYDNLIEGGAGADILDGGKGKDNDTVSYASSAAGVTVNLGLKKGTQTGGDAEGDVLKNFESVLGSAFDDVLTGGKAPGILDGGAGDDVLIGGAKGNTFFGGAGMDTVVITGTKLVLAGFDAATNSIEALTAVKSVGVTGTAADETFDFSSLAAIENLGFVDAGAGDDTIIGSDAWNGDLRGNAGNDRLHGGTGDDILTGGKGADAFVFNFGDGHDTIADLTFDKKNSALDDHIELFGFGTDYASDVRAHMTQVGKNVVIDFHGDGSDTLTIMKTTIDILDAHQGSFVLL